MEAHGGVDGAAMDAAWWLAFQVAAMEAAGVNRCREEGGSCGGALLLQWLSALLFVLQVRVDLWWTRIWCRFELLRFTGLEDGDGEDLF
ncbi:hypothetical protein DEO72_LG5g1443 [Vigna unguiculata]|uniref:Uncharacterized protein n=1 Tax=Vigna unguiculata TaxID=3917 RepID=A0A4D6LYG1_VIGUN|nr:hypothetical protein DEO72_LG5g1443 [Vigna unguiculata]